ncbi:uncharacterized protein BT62DRAFT_726817 [Guyanagaster necrorhizus]|uniref:DUF6699 domain-containing protein n=1 Tax=Guyanagaster necrorhizus TaxID=856835 RepID=A0A9P8AV51_9AGAR|nr:uncharacterized protein BT62DRAFT_726817 [Guyanagaster necrorhizus MCA 3950]KAG7448761.1 hypothetical protein BT62DRAFT_726817 [Guyanagaster necrorhizus MCA 3950]
MPNAAPHPIIAYRIDNSHLNDSRYQRGEEVRAPSSCRLYWDMWKDPEYFAIDTGATDSNGKYQFIALARAVVDRHIRFIIITCGAFPESWGPIHVENARNHTVTIHNVLQSIYRYLCIPLTHAEQAALSHKQREMMMRTLFANPGRASTLNRGHYLGANHYFGGLTPSLRFNDTYILTLRRSGQGQARG